MAHRKNPRSLRFSLWRNPVFVQYRKGKERRNTWTRALQISQALGYFGRKIGEKRKTPKGKKMVSLQKQARPVFYSSHYQIQRISLFSKNESFQNQESKQKKRNKKKSSSFPKKFEILEI